MAFPQVDWFCRIIDNPCTENANLTAKCLIHEQVYSSQHWISRSPTTRYPTAAGKPSERRVIGTREVNCHEMDWWFGSGIQVLCSKGNETGYCKCCSRRRRLSLVFDLFLSRKVYQDSGFQDFILNVMGFRVSTVYYSSALSSFALLWYHFWEEETENQYERQAERHFRVEWNSMWSEYQRKPSCRLTKPQETADTYTAGQSRKLSNNSDTHRENLDLQTFCTDRSQLTARPKNHFTGIPLWIAQTDGKTHHNVLPITTSSTACETRLGS